MSKKYLVKNQDCISGIAYDEGMHPDTIWLDADNSALKKERGNADYLREGDEISIRDKEKMQLPATTGSKHAYLRKALPFTPFVCSCASGLEFGVKSRKVRLPIDPDWGSELYVIATGEEDNRLFSEVTSTATGAHSCMKGMGDRPEVITTINNKPVKSTLESKSKVFATNDAGLDDTVPAFQLIRYVFDLITQDKGSVGVATSKLGVCNLAPDLKRELKVNCFNPMSVTGKVDIQMSSFFGTAGAGGSLTAGGDLAVKIGRQEIKLEKRTKDLSGKNKPDKSVVGDESSALLDIVYDVLTESDDASASYKDDAKTGSSYVEIASTIGFVIGQFSLAEEAKGPGLTVSASGLKLTWDPILKLTGHLDILDVVLNSCATPAVATAVRKIRAKIASGESVSGKAEAYLEFAGSIKLDVGLKCDEVIKFSPLENSRTKRKVEPDVLGGGKIEGKGLTGLSAKAESWFIKFEAAVDGSLYTSFLYEVKDDSGTTKCRKGFEGLFAEIKAHMKVGVSRKRPPPPGAEKKESPVSADQGNAKGNIKKAIFDPRMSEWVPFNV